ncbi:hypothetical protein [Actinoallomurus iriomotensis]|uniref:Ig-like domain-containing protein n=1 Tax=Actinoallomurus iriomotensis TaxID=478107 RepID=A0A9W6VSP3_9ACTN|nr:hypothetical protein [Actinoallomurus iriomotensis]GLY78890.1 hypothetical protein Airi01_071570 [Actinoallomurus iriomotensis]
MLVRRPSSGSSPFLPAVMAMTGLALSAAALTPDSAGAVSRPRAGRAHAARTAGTTACGGSQTVAYSPGLTTRPQEITIHGTSTLIRCVSSADPAITAARSTFHATGRLSCVSGRYSGTRKVTWNNGRTSTMSFTAVVSVNAGQSVVAIKGTVTDGEFDGQKWSAAYTMSTARPQSCATREGLPTVAGRLLLTVGSAVPGAAAPDLSRPTRH